MTPQRIGVVILAAMAVGCGGEGSPPPSADTADASSVVDAAPDDVAVASDQAPHPEDTDGASSDTDVGLPLLEAWLLLNPAEGIDTVAVQPAVAWDGKGRVAVVWTGRQGDGSGIQGGLWSPGVPHVEVAPPTFLTTASDGLRNEPRLCALSGAEDRTFAAAWSADLRDGSAENLAVFTRTLSAPFAAAGEAERRLRTLPTGSHWLATLACATDAEGGCAVAGVRSGANAGFEVFVQRLDDIGEPVGEAVAPRPSDGGGQLFPAVAMSPAGDVFVAFEESPGGEAPSSLYLAHVAAPGEVSVRSLDAAIPPPAAGAALGATDSGVLVAGGTPVGLRYVWRDGAGELTVVANPDGGTASTGAAAMADLGDGRLGVVWLRAAANNQHDLRFSVFKDGAFVGETLTLATGRYPVAYRPAIAARDGRLAIAFTESLGGGAFTVRVALSSVPQHVEAP